LNLACSFSTGAAHDREFFFVGAIHREVGGGGAFQKKPSLSASLQTPRATPHTRLGGGRGPALGQESREGGYTRQSPSDSGSAWVPGEPAGSLAQEAPWARPNAGAEPLLGSHVTAALLIGPGKDPAYAHAEDPDEGA
jgi:hypothetical protein